MNTYDLLWFYLLGAASPVAVYVIRDYIERRKPKRCAWCHQKQAAKFAGGVCAKCLDKNASECGDAAPDGWPKA